MHYFRKIFISIKSQLYNTQSKYHSAFTRLHKSIFKNETDKFPKRLLSIFIFPPILFSFQLQERRILLTTTLQKKKNNKTHKKVTKFPNSSWSKYLTRIIPASDISSIFPVILPLSSFLNKQGLRDSGLLLIEQAYSPRRIWISVAVGYFLRALSSL